jgi:hypothetical protein
MPTDPVLKWLLEGDPAIRWQALRDLKGAAERTVRREQRRVADEGWGALLLSLQDPDGRWAGGINFWSPRHKRSETCVSGMLLAVLCWFGMDDPRVDRLAEHVVAQQMSDGGWNCRAMPGYGGATPGSFHTTISVLEGLMEYERFRKTGTTTFCAASTTFGSAGRGPTSGWKRA